jgi:hypothetical protein
MASEDLRSLYFEALDKLDQPRPAALRPAERVDAAIVEFQKRKIPVKTPHQLVDYLCASLTAVQQGRRGFDLSQFRTDEGKFVPFPTGGTRFFYGGPVSDPQAPGGSGPTVPSRVVAELAVEKLHSRGVPASTLEKLGDAAAVDRLNLWDDDLEVELRKPLAAAIENRPELAKQVRDESGKPSLKKFAALVWKEGLSAQYAREIDGPVGVINTAPFERQTWFENERPAALGNGHTTRDDITYAGFAFEPLSAAQLDKGQKSQPLPEFTGPLTDRAADAYITFPAASAEAEPVSRHGLQTHPNLEELYQRAVRTRDDICASTPTVRHKPATNYRTHPQYPPNRPTR